MSNDVADEQHGTDEQQPPLNEAAVLAACARLFGEWIAPILSGVTDAPEARLIEAFEESGQSSVVAKVGALDAGTYTVSRSRGKFEVADEKAVDQWAEDHEGMEVIIRRRPAWEKALLQFAKQTPTGEIVDTRTGEVIPGLRYVPGGRPTGNVRWTWADGGKGRDALLEAWRRGDLDDILGGRLALPAPPSNPSA